MFRASYNRAVLRIRITTVTPLRIGAGDVTLDPSGADLTCVRTRHGQHGSTVYIPGSSLKGVLRSAAEANVRGRNFGAVVGSCDDPLDRDGLCNRGASNKARQPTHEIHKALCLTCRLFGSLAIKGRASVRDLFPWSEEAGTEPRVAPGGSNHLSANQLEVRHGVSINRMTGSVENGPFDLELVPAGVAFFGDIALENYQACQLGLLVAAFDQVNDGIAQLGSSKSRGLGVASIAVERIVHEQAGTHAKPYPVEVGALVTSDDAKRYGLAVAAALPIADGVARGLATRFDVQDTAPWLDAGRRALGAQR